jgi:Plasmid pRiA4b ORF-3-like protein
MTAAAIAHLRIKLNDVEPAVLRHLQVPVTIRLDRLHLVLQAAMGWSNTHLYEIRAGDVGWGVPDPDFGAGPLDASKVRLIDVLEDVGPRSLEYLYDFGDGWITPSTSSASPVLCQAWPTPAWSRRAGAARRRMWAVPGAIASSSMPSPIPTTRSTPNGSNGSADPSTQRLSICTGSPTQ